MASNFLCSCHQRAERILYLDSSRGTVVGSATEKSPLLIKFNDAKKAFEEKRKAEIKTEQLELEQRGRCKITQYVTHNFHLSHSDDSDSSVACQVLRKQQTWNRRRRNTASPHRIIRSKIRSPETDDDRNESSSHSDSIYTSPSIVPEQCYLGFYMGRQSPVQIKRMRTSRARLDFDGCNEGGSSSKREGRHWTDYPPHLGSSNEGNESALKFGPSSNELKSRSTRYRSSGTKSTGSEDRRIREAAVDLARLIKNRAFRRISKLAANLQRLLQEPSNGTAGCWYG